MKLSIQLSFILLSSSFLIGCSGKSFTLQSYADEYFNDKDPQESVQNTTTKEENEPSNHDASTETTDLPSSNIDDDTTNAAIKSGPGSDIAWSSTYKKNKENKGQGALQKNLDAWTQENWEPAFEGDENQSIKDKEANKHFNLQHYVDKVEKYMEKKEAEKEGQPEETPHYEKVNKLPVIGN